MSSGRVLLGVSASVAAFKAVEILRTLTKRGYDVRVVPTRASLNFVGPNTWEALSGHPCYTEVFEAAGEMDHVRLGEWADFILVAPATADFLARARHGFADDLLTATILASPAPIYAAPAMHTGMWINPATRENVAALEQRGWHFIGPVTGDLAGGDTGEGRLADPSTIVDAVSTLPQQGPLSGRKIVITAGGTHEPIDQVRFLGNLSSGKQGCALAVAAMRQGAQVSLVAANVAEHLLPAGADVTKVSSALDMREAVLAQCADADAVIMAAAVADWRPANTVKGKLNRQNTPQLSLDLVANPDILGELMEARVPGQVIVGFAAQTGTYAEALAAGIAKAQRKRTDLTVVNPVGEGRGFGADDNQIAVLDAEGRVLSETSGSKAEVAQTILEYVAQCLPK